MELKLDIFTSEMMGLTFDFQVNPDSCANNIHYENYIKFSAISDNVYGYGTTHVLIGNDCGREKLIGFITLRASSYIVMQDNIAHGEPALEIMELAVDKRYEHLGHGNTLVDYAISVADDTNEFVLGIKYIVVCADEQAVPFYVKNGFHKLSDYGLVPRNGANDNCVPMIVRIRE